MEDHRSLHPHLAFLVRRCDPAVECHDADVRPLHRLAVGVRQLLVGVVGRAVRDHRHLGHAVAVHHAPPADLVAHLVVDLGRLGRPAAGHEPERREDRLLRGLALLTEVGHVERGAPAHHGGAVPAEEREHVGCREGLDEDGREAHGQHGDEIVRPGDVCEGKGDGADVVGPHVQGAGEAPAAGDQRLVGVLHALGVGRRAGRVVDPADRRVLGRRPLGRRRQRGGIAFGQAVVGGEDGRTRRGAGQRSVGDGGEVGAPPGGGDDEELGPGLAEGEADLALAVEVDDRVLDGAEAGERERQDDGVDPGRQLPRDDGARRDAQSVQTSRDPLDPVSELAEADRLAIRRNEHGMVRRHLGSAVDQLPHGAGAGEYLARGHDPSFRDHSHSSWRRWVGWARRAARVPAGQNGCVARRPVHSEARGWRRMAAAKSRSTAGARSA